MKPHVYVFRILAVLTTINIMIFLALVVYWRSRRVALVEPSFCYSKDTLSSGNPNLLKQLIELNDKNTDRNTQCDKLSDVLKEIVKQQTANRYNSNSCPEYPSLNLADFDCMISEREVNTMQLKHIGSHERPVTNKPTKLFWKSTKNSAGGLKHLRKEGSIYIHTSGRYYVSTQLTTRTANASIHNVDLTVKHLVYLVSAKEGTETILLEHVISACEMCTELSEQSSNMGAAFNLEEKDRIYIATSHPYHIVSGHGRDYLSVHML